MFWHAPWRAPWRARWRAPLRAPWGIMGNPFEHSLGVIKNTPGSYQKLSPGVIKNVKK
jgi:hypothetical protein